MVARWSLCACLFLATAVACGGESRSHRDGSSGAPGVAAGTGGLAGAEGIAGGDGGGGFATGGGEAARAGAGATVPTKDGVPIGDCRERDPSEQLLAGCPDTAPAEATACDAAQEGNTCRYTIHTAPELMSAEQDTAICKEGTWRGPFLQQCSVTCHALTGTNVLSLDASDCAARARLDCYPIDVSAVVSPTAQTLMDWKLQTLLSECVTPLPYGEHVEVDFSDGCPSSLATAVTLDPSIVACLAAKLTGVRYDCAVPLPCSTWLLDLI